MTSKHQETTNTKESTGTTIALTVNGKKYELRKDGKLATLIVRYGLHPPFFQSILPPRSLI